jgi:hypothetical protein
MSKNSHRSSGGHPDRITKHTEEPWPYRPAGSTCYDAVIAVGQILAPAIYAPNWRPLIKVIVIWLLAVVILILAKWPICIGTIGPLDSP